MKQTVHVIRMLSLPGQRATRRNSARVLRTDETNAQRIVMDYRIGWVEMDSEAAEMECRAKRKSGVDGDNIIGARSRRCVRLVDAMVFISYGSLWDYTI